MIKKEALPNISDPKSSSLHRKKILFCEAGAHGGSVKRLINLLNNLDLDTFQPSVLTYFQTSKAKNLLNLPLVPSASLGLTSFPAPDVLVNYRSIPIPTPFGLKYFITAIKRMLSCQPDVIYLNNTPFCHLPMILAAKLFKKKLICHMRDCIRLTRSELWALDNVTRIVVLSESHRVYYNKQGVADEKMVVIYNGIDLNQFDEASQQHAHLPNGNDNIIAFVGVLSGRKRQEDALLALFQILPSFPGTKLLFLGDGPDREKLQFMAREKGLEEKVLFAGMVPNVAPYLKASKVGLMISEREGMPNVILEYMAAWLPVIATDLPGVGEMVQDGETGSIVPVGDVEAIASCLRNFLASKELCDRMGAAGRNVLESGKFTVERELKDIEDVISYA